MKFYFDIVNIGNDNGFVKFECAIISNLNLIDIIKFKRTYFSQNFGTSFFRGSI